MTAPVWGKGLARNLSSQAYSEYAVLFADSRQTSILAWALRYGDAWYGLLASDLQRDMQLNKFDTPARCRVGPCETFEEVCAVTAAAIRLSGEAPCLR